MQNAMAELPLAIFTTLAPIGAGGFIALAAILFGVSLQDEQLKKLDKLALVPLIVAAVGFVASIFHLANPANILNVFNGLGTSPLSNEIAVGVVFFGLAFVYCVLGLAGMLNGGMRKGFAAVVAVAALVFAIFCGLAYMIDTIPSWNTAFSPVAMVGFCLLGGTLLGTLMLGMAGAFEAAREGSFKTSGLALAVIGAVLALVGVFGQLATVGGLSTSAVAGAALTSELTTHVAIFAVGAIIALACQLLLLLGKIKGNGAGIAGLGLVVSVAAVFVARLVFYALEMSVGL